jgi:hypothetical protein
LKKIGDNFLMLPIFQSMAKGEVDGRSDPRKEEVQHELL